MEIMSEKLKGKAKDKIDVKVVTHLSFVHCIQPDTMHFIYFNKDLTRMYERLKYERHYLYKRGSEKMIQDRFNNKD